MSRSGSVTIDTSAGCIGRRVPEVVEFGEPLGLRGGAAKIPTPWPVPGMRDPSHHPSHVPTAARHEPLRATKAAARAAALQRAG